MSINRRFFLKSSGVALAGLGAMTASPSFLTRTLAGTRGSRRILVAIFQRGAMDGLNAVVPFGDQEYYRLRPGIAVPRAGEGGVIDLDGYFGLHPALASFKPLYDERQLAIVHAVGSPDNTRSHFDAQDYMESGTPGVKSTSDGWLNRYLQARPDSRVSPFRAVAMGANMPRVMQGQASAIAMNNINDFTIRAGRGPAAQQVAGGFEAMYEQAANDALRGTGRETFDALKMLKSVNPAQYQPEPGVQYPRGQFGNRLRQIAQLVKSDIGLEIAFTDIGGWDTHANQGSFQGQLSLRLAEFSQGISALYADLRKQADEVVILTMTEFGRTARENGNRGTDHGHASVMFVIGGSINGGKIYGDWPGIATEQLYERRDLAVTTDFRDLFGEVAKAHLGAADLKNIFPGYAVDQSKFKGMFRV